MRYVTSYYFRDNRIRFTLEYITEIRVRAVRITAYDSKMIRFVFTLKIHQFNQKSALLEEKNFISFARTWTQFITSLSCLYKSTSLRSVLINLKSVRPMWNTIVRFCSMSSDLCWKMHEELKSHISFDKNFILSSDQPWTWSFGNREFLHGIDNRLSLPLQVSLYGWLSLNYYIVYQR